jgi:hypothetical protein
MRQSKRERQTRRRISCRATTNQTADSFPCNPRFFAILFYITIYAAFKASPGELLAGCMPAGSGVRISYHIDLYGKVYLLAGDLANRRGDERMGRSRG